MSWGGLLVVTVTALASAAAQPRTATADGFSWTAPATCPQVDDVRDRVAHRLGRPLVELPDVAIKVWRSPSAYVARIDPRGQTLATSARTLHSARCDVLADAVAVVIARLATEGDPAVASIAAPPTEVAMLVPIDVAPIDVASVRAAAVVKPTRWGGGIDVLGLSGVGALPDVNVGFEVTGLVRRDHQFVSVGVSRWVPAEGGEVELRTSVARAGWAPTHLPLRAWGLAEVGRMTRTGSGGSDSARWLAVGAGFGVAWPMTDHARLIGTFEVAVPLERAPLVDQLGTFERPSVAAARCAFGLELGWP